MFIKKSLRLKRAYYIRKKIFLLNIKRLSIFKSNKNFYCQIISEHGDVLAGISNIDKNLKFYILFNYGKNINLNICGFLGKCIAYKGLLLGIKFIAFDRSGYKYHGCVKMLALYCRKFGLNF